jgi:hypothetical protein
MIWIAYTDFIVLGSKDQYGGESFLEVSNNSIIYVQINYRVLTCGVISNCT